MTPNLFDIQVDGNTYAMTPTGLLDELTYRNYYHNRQRTPEITPTEWRKAIPEFTEAMEQRYQQERPLA